MAIPTFDPSAPTFTRTGINLAAPRLGAHAVLTSNDFFATMDRMLASEPAVFILGKCDDNGKWMDGWETRRKRTTGHDFCIVKLGVATSLMGVDIDTSHFTGNFPPAASIDACRSDEVIPPSDTRLTEVLPAVALNGNAHHFRATEVATGAIFTHVRLNIYPDGGVARLRVFGRPHRELARDAQIDLASAMNGALIVATNTEHCGLASNLLLRTSAANMREGRETRRRREPGFDWCIVELAVSGEISRIDVDTAHFKGNFADCCSLQGAFVTAATGESLITQSIFWPVLLGEQALEMGRLQEFMAERIMPVTHVRFNILPDGAVSRLRRIGRTVGRSS